MHCLQPSASPVADVLDPYIGVERVPRPGGCWVMANMVAGLDGTAAKAGRVAEMSSARDHELFLRLRGLADVVLVGAQTVRREQYGPVCLSPDLQSRRRDLGQGTPRMAIVSRSLDLDPALPVFASCDPLPIVVTCEQSDRSRLAGVPTEILIAGEDHVDIGLVLAEFALRSMSIVLCEGGPTLLGQLIADDLLDEFCLTLSPVVGGDPLPVVNTAGLSELKHFRIAGIAQDESTLFLRYIGGSPP